MKRTVILVMGLIAILGSSFASAAVPPLDPETRKEISSHIFVGTVTEVSEKDVEVRKDFVNTYYTAVIQVISTSKVGAELTLNSGDVTTVKFWKVKKRPRGWAGPQGQNHLLKAGEKVEVFSYWDSTDGDAGGLRLLTPNGVEVVKDEL